MFCVTVQSTAQTKESVKKDSIPFLQGIWIEVDVAPVFERALINKNAYRAQGNIQVNLKNKYYPVIEFGYAGADKTASNGIEFSTSGFFGKAGADLSMLKPKPNSTQKNNNFLVGLRLGASRFNYSLYNQTITDNYWGNSETFNLESISSTKLWYEIAAGMRVEVFRNIYMGWTIRNKHLISKTESGQTTPWYIPGYGIGNTSVWGLSYSIGYRIK